MLTEQQQILRRGNITASSVYKIMSEPRNKADKEAGMLSETGKTYVKKIVAEYISGSHIEITSKEMDWGNHYEPIARNLFSKVTGFQITEIDNYTTPDFPECSCTPDGVNMSERFGIEIKCPFTLESHLENLLLKDQYDLLAEKPEYYYQIQFNLMLTNLQKWYYISFHPEFINEIEGKEVDKRLFAIPILPDLNVFDKIKSQINKALTYKHQLLQLILC
jgi:hypothetical protein